MVVRISKILMVAAIAFFATLVSFGNLTDYGTNLAFVDHVLDMDTLFPDTTIRYRAITSPTWHQMAYFLIIAAEVATALLCWIGAFRMLAAIRQEGVAFRKSKSFAVAGLTTGFLVWQVGFMSIGGEWFGMWMSQQWNGVPSAFRFVVTILAVLIYVALPDED